MNKRPTPEELEQQKKWHKHRKYLRALYNGTLTPRNRPKVPGFTSGNDK